MKQIRIALLPFLFFVYIFHLLAYIFSDNKKKIVSDVKSLKMRLNLDLPNILMILYLLSYDKYFFTLFNYRIKNNKLRHFLYRNNSTHFILPDDVQIGYNLFYEHPYSTILNAKSIGNNFSCKHLTTIGNKHDDENLRPVILNNVSLGAGVTIIGDITIGNNVIIGAGSVVVKSIPDNCVVVGNPSKIIRKNEI